MNTNLEANLCELLGIDEKTTIKDKGRLAHVIINLLPIKLTELLPLGGNDHCLSFMACIDGGGADLDLLLD